MVDIFEQQRLHRQELTRGLALKLLEAWGVGQKCQESFLRHHVNLELLAPMPLKQFRDQINYLEGKGMLKVDRGYAIWRIMITSEGVDVSQGKIDVPGIQIVGDNYEQA